MSNRLVSVIIVTTGIRDYLWPCLDSIRKQTRPHLEIIVIDNSLNLNFSRQIKELDPAIQLIASPRNLFYCAALNKGIEMSSGDFTLCLNDDVILDRKFIEEALKAFNIDKRIGMVSGKILRSDGKTLDSTGLFLTCWRTAKERGYGLRDTGQFEKEEFIFGVNGAVAFYLKEMLEDIKINSEYFDSDYRIFYEDLDIAWRAQNFGWKAYYLPRAIAYHVRGATVRNRFGIGKPYARSYLNNDLHLDLIKNRYLAIIKNESWLNFLSHIPFILSYDILAWGYVLISRPVLIKRFISNFKTIKSAFRKRMLSRR